MLRQAAVQKDKEMEELVPWITQREEEIAQLRVAESVLLEVIDEKEEVRRNQSN